MNIVLLVNNEEVKTYFSHMVPRIGDYISLTSDINNPGKTHKVYCVELFPSLNKAVVWLS